jgi:mRNA interferase MazF
VAGITSNLKMKGIPLSKSEGAVKDSVIKLNYIFAISEVMISRVVFQLTKEKKNLVFREFERDSPNSKDEFEEKKRIG